MYIVLDLETTGLDPLQDEIIEIACIKIHSKTLEELDRLHCFFRPQKEIPRLISTITHIDAEDLVGAGEFSQMREDIQDFIGGYPIVGHNISFDIRFLQSHGVDIAHNPKIDTFFFANFLCYQSTSLNLGYLCEVYDIELKNAHRAIDDTLATHALFQKLLRDIQTLKGARRDIVYFFLKSSRDPGIKSICEACNIASDIDLEQCFEMYLASHKKNQKSFQTAHKNMQDIDDKQGAKNMESMYETLLQKPGFDLRKGQKEMIDMVDNVLQNGAKLAIEAPTGIGKTFAYLLPAIMHAQRFGETVHISTSTKALQDQIYYKDLVFLCESLGVNISYSKLKGKKNYLSLSSLSEYLESHFFELSSQQTSCLIKLMLWSMHSEYGELDELDFYGEEHSYVADLHAGNAGISYDTNIYWEDEFLHLARKRAQSSHIVITNNNILFQDIASDGAILGSLKHLIIDEAHKLEDVVTQSLKKQISYSDIEKLLARVEDKILKKKMVCEDFTFLRQHILFDAAEVFSQIEGYIFSHFRPSDSYKYLLLQNDFFHDATPLKYMSKKIIASLESLQGKLGDLSDTNPGAFIGDLQEIENLVVSLKTLFIFSDQSKYIYFAGHNDHSGAYIGYTVLRPGEFLEKNLWENISSAVLTSATLQLQDNFDYMRDMLHLQSFQMHALDGEFDYSQQALVFIPQDLGDIRKNLGEVIDFLAAFCSCVGGKTLILFTAYSAIREAFIQLEPLLSSHNISLFAQSIGGSKHKQIEQFRNNSSHSILMGTDTFWEGIDIPGSDLEYLIIHKIPFHVPSDPIFQARCGLFTRSFEQYAIPKAILKLRQGFGRLIRSREDKGIIIFLDNRVYDTAWGESFLGTFPRDIKIRYGSTSQLLELLKDNSL